MRIRPATPADAARLAEIYRPHVEDSAVSFEEVAPDAAEMARRHAARGAFPWLVAEADDEVLGFAYGAPFRERAAYRYSCEVTVYVDADAQGRGVGRALYTQLLEELRALEQYTAFAVIAEPEVNVASVALHRALGFDEVGVLPRAGWKIGAWRSVGIFARALRDGAPCP